PDAEADGTGAVSLTRGNYDDAVNLARRLASAGDLELLARARLTRGWALHAMPISHVHVGMRVPVYADGAIVDAVVTDVEWEDFAGMVYDLSITNLRNYVAGGIVVHNSVYGWRGADIRFILAFEEDYADAKILKPAQT